MQSINANEIALQIRAAHEGVVMAVRTSLTHAHEAGRLLTAAKNQKVAPHGEWEGWVRDVVGLPVRTAQLYQQIAKHWDEIEPRLEDVETITDALTVIRNGRRKAAPANVGQASPFVASSAAPVPAGKQNVAVDVTDTVRGEESVVAKVEEIDKAAATTCDYLRAVVANPAAYRTAEAARILNELSTALDAALAALD